MALTGNGVASAITAALGQASPLDPFPGQVQVQGIMPSSQQQQLSGAASGERALKMRARRLEKMLNGTAPLLPSIGQRLLLCFEYLDIDGKGYFTLKDLAERGRLVFSQLALPGHDNSFAIMDSFHHFDRHTGRVHLEDLGVGLVERLQGLAANDALLRCAAREIVPSGKKSNIDIIAMLRSGSLPSTFRHHFGPHVESIVGELLVATEPQNAGGGSQSSAIVVEYYSAGRLVEVLQRSIELACADICAVLHLPAGIRVRLAEESLSGYHFFDGRASAPQQQQGRKYLSEKIESFSWQVKGPLIKNLPGAASSPQLSPDDADADAIDAENDALDDLNGPDPSAPFALGEGAGPDGRDASAQDGGDLNNKVDEAKSARQSGSGVSDEWELDEVEVFLLAQAREAISRFFYLTAAKNSARTSQNPMEGSLRAVAEALGLSIADGGESALRQIADINSIKVMSRYLPLSKEVLFLDNSSISSGAKSDGSAEGDILPVGASSSIPISFPVSAPSAAQNGAGADGGAAGTAQSRPSFGLGDSASAGGGDMGGKGLGEVNYKLLLKFNDMQDRLLRAQIRLQVMEGKQTELSTPKGEWEADEDEGVGRTEAVGSATGHDAIVNGGEESDRGSDTSDATSFSADESEGPDSGDGTSTSDMGDGSSSGDDSDSSLRSFVSKGTVASRRSSKAPSSSHRRRRRRGHRKRGSGSPVLDRHQKQGANGGGNGEQEAETSTVGSDMSSDSEGGAIDLQPEVLFDDILKGLAELEQLAVCTVHSECFSGTLLEKDCAIIPYTTSGLQLSASPVDVSKVLSGPAAASGSSTIAIDSSASQRPSAINTLPPVKESVDLSAFDELVGQLNSVLAEKRRMVHQYDDLQMKLYMSEERIAEVEMQLEQSRRDREESTNVSVEVQVLREKNARLSSEEQALFQMQQRNSELTQRLGELQREMRELGDLGLRTMNKDMSSQARGVGAAGRVGAENTPGSSNGDGIVISLGGTSSNTTLSKSEQELRANLKQIADLSSQRDRLVKENQRLKLAAKQADQRMKATLQDHLTLRQKLNQTEDDLAASKMQISNLMGEIDHERSLRGDRDALVKKSQELHVEVVELRGVVEESRLASVQLVKAKEDLASAEDQIALLEERLADITQEAELNSIGHNQVDNLRSMLELRSRENRDLVLQVQGLERRVQELQALETRYSDATDELVEVKFKVEQIPPLLADLSRAKASVRATARTLQEQDKTVSGLRRRCVELEAEAARLRQETRTMEELRSRVRASEADRDRYVQETREIPLLKAQLKKYQEDLKSLDASHRRVKKMMRQTAIVSGANVGQQQQQQQQLLMQGGGGVSNLSSSVSTGSGGNYTLSSNGTPGVVPQSFDAPLPVPSFSSTSGSVSSASGLLFSSGSPLASMSSSPPTSSSYATPASASSSSSMMLSNSALLSSMLLGGGGGGGGNEGASNPYFNLFGTA